MGEELKSYTYDYKDGMSSTVGIEELYDRINSHDDLHIRDRFVEYDKKNKENVAYLTYILEKREDEGEWGLWIKVVKLCKVFNVPKELREKKALMVSQDELLSSIWRQGINFLTIYANMPSEKQGKNETEGFFYCYGIQVTEMVKDHSYNNDIWYDSDSSTKEKITIILNALKRKADAQFYGVVNLLRGNFRQSQFLPLTMKEAEAIRQNIENADNLQVVRGIPKTHISAASGVTTTMNGLESTPDGVEQNEEFIRSLLHTKYANIVMAYPIRSEDLIQWSQNTAKELSRYKSQYSGMISHNAGVSIPMVFAGNLSATMGNTTGVTDTSGQTLGVTNGLSDNYTHGVGVNNGQSHTLGLSDGQSVGVADSVSQSNTNSNSQGLTNSQTLSDSQGVSRTESNGVTDGVSNTHGVSKSHSVGSTDTYAQGQTFSKSQSHSLGQSLSESQSFGETYGQTLGHTIGHTNGITDGTSLTSGHTIGNTTGHTVGHTIGDTYGTTVGNTTGTTQGTTVGTTYGHTTGTTHGITDGTTIGTTQGTTTGHTTGNSQTYGQSYGTSQNHGISNTTSDGTSDSNTYSRGHSISNNMSHTMSNTASNTASYSASNTQSHGTTSGVTNGYTTGNTFTDTLSTGGNRTFGANGSLDLGVASFGGNTGGGINGSHSSANGLSLSNSNSFSHSTSNTEGHSFGATNGVSRGVSDGVSYGRGVTDTASNGISHGTTHTNAHGITDSYGTTMSNTNSYGYTNSDSTSQSLSHSNSNSHSISNSTSNSDSVSRSASNSLSHSNSHSVSNSLSHSLSNSFSDSMSRSLSDSLSQGLTHSLSRSLSDSNSLSNSHSLSASHGLSRGLTEGYSEGITQGRSLTHSVGKSISDGVSETASQGLTHSKSHSLSNGITNSQSRGTSVGNTNSLSQGVSNGVGKTANTGLTQSLSDSQGVTKGNSISDSRGNGTTNSKSNSLSNAQGLSNARSAALGSGQGLNFSFGPTIGVSRSYQVFDEEKGNLVKLLEVSNTRMNLATRMGAFYVDAYIVSHDANAMQSIALASVSSWGGDNEMSTVQCVTPDNFTQSHLLKHASVFEPCTMKENIAGIADNYLWSTIMLTSELAAMTHLPRVETGGTSTVATNIPAFSVFANKDGEIYFGKQINPEDGLPSYDYYFSKKEFMHTLICGASGCGKTTSAVRMAREVIRNYQDMKLFVLDWKNSWRVLKRFSLNGTDDFEFYGMDYTSIRPITMNLYIPPKYVGVNQWVDKVNESICLGYGFGTKMLSVLKSAARIVLICEGILRVDATGAPIEWKPKNQAEQDEFNKKIANVSLDKIYQVVQGMKNAGQSTGRGTGMKGSAVSIDPSIPQYVQTKMLDIRNMPYYQQCQEGYNKAIEIITGRFNKSGMGMQDAYDSILAKLESFYSGELKPMYCCNDYEKCIKIEDMIDGKRIVVLEGGDLDANTKKAIIGLISWGMFMYSRLKKNRDKIVEKRFYILEEAHRIIDNPESGNAPPLDVGETIFEILLNEAREYGVYCMIIVQTPTALPPAMITNCSILIIHRLGNDKDIQLMTTMLCRNARLDNRDVPIWLAKEPIGQAIVRLNNTAVHQMSEPCLVQVARCDNEPPDNEELVLDMDDVKIPDYIRKSMNDDDYLQNYYSSELDKFINHEDNEIDDQYQDYCDGYEEHMKDVG